MLSKIMYHKLKIILENTRIVKIWGVRMVSIHAMKLFNLTAEWES